MNTILSINWNWDPEIFNVYGFSVRYYSLMFVGAFLIGLRIMKKIYISDGISEEKLDPLFMYTFFGMLIGMRFGEVFFYSWDYYKNHIIEMVLPIREEAGAVLFGFIEGWKFTGFSGLASHGAAIAIPISLYFYSKKHLGKSWLFILDRVAITVALAGFFIRFGNFFNSEIYGKPTDSAFGVIFERAKETIPRHPTQMYEALSYLTLFFVLWYLFWKTDKKKNEGYLFGIFMVVLWGLRLVIEYLKEPQVVGREDFFLGLNTGQLLSVPLIGVGLWLVFRKHKKEA